MYYIDLWYMFNKSCLIVMVLFNFTLELFKAES